MHSAPSCQINGCIIPSPPQPATRYQPLFPLRATNPSEHMSGGGPTNTLPTQSSNLQCHPIMSMQLHNIQRRVMPRLTHQDQRDIERAHRTVLHNVQPSTAHHAQQLRHHPRANLSNGTFSALAIRFTSSHRQLCRRNRPYNLCGFMPAHSATT